MNGIFHYSESGLWRKPFAAHDLGHYPCANGQHYSGNMPVEECGNMLISLAAIAEAEGHAGFASRWWSTVKGWAEYLERFGFDPGDQLCTDDFAGHLAHNANLSIKTIEALAAYGRLSEMRGERAVAAKYRRLAEELAAKWCEAAKGGRHGAYRLAFDRADSWSLKYNLVWDTLLGFKLFPPEVAMSELKAYRAEALSYGVPLDSRAKYTKADWLVWAGSLTGRREDLEFMVGGIRRYLNDTRDRFAFCDWYWADKAARRGFMARSVVGGVFLPVLRHPELLKKYRGE